MVRRRRRRRYLWLPVQGTAGTGGLEENNWYGTAFSHGTVPANGLPTAGVTDVTYDREQDLNTGITVATPMVEFISSAYMLRRIVGNVWGSLDQNTDATRTPAAILTCGFFVGRSEESDLQGGPIASGSTALILQNYGPQNADNAMEPWIWRRSWVLGNGLITSAVGPSKFPPTTGNYVGVDGPRIEAKTMRRIEGDNRLYFAFEIRNYPINFIAANASGFDLNFEVRLLGRPLTRGKRGAF